MILSPQTIRRLGILDPAIEETRYHGVSCGFSHAGYDLRLGDEILIPARGFVLASAMERFRMLGNVMGVVHDKSTWARRGLSVLNTVIEPGWQGYLTMEIVNHSDKNFVLPKGVGIAQVVFQFLDEPTENKYSGKYQYQNAGPQPAKDE